MWHMTLQEKFIVCCSHQRLERSYLLLNSPQIQIICDSYMRSRVGETKYCLSQDQGMCFAISAECIRIDQLQYSYFLIELPKIHIFLYHWTCWMNSAPSPRRTHQCLQSSICWRASTISVQGQTDDHSGMRQKFLLGTGVSNSWFFVSLLLLLVSTTSIQGKTQTCVESFY